MTVTKKDLSDNKTIEISDKNKQDWENFIKNKEKIPNKDFVNKKSIRYEKIKKIDLHGYTIEEANKAVEQFIQKCFDESVTKISYNCFISNSCTFQKLFLCLFIKVFID